MLINPANLKAFQFTLDTEFNKARAEVIPDERSIAKALFYEKQALNRKKVAYPAIVAKARVQKLTKGEPQEKQKLPANYLEIEAGKASVLIAIDEFDLACDEEGLYIDMVRADGSDIADFDERYAALLLTNGFTALSGITGDTGTFFADARKVSIELGAASPTYDNKHAGALAAGTYDAARKALYNMADAKGRPRVLGNRGFTLVCGPENEAAAMDLLKTQQLANGGTNKYYNTADLIVSPYLGTSTAWFLAANSSGFAGRPLIKQTNLNWQSRMTGTDSVSQIVDGEILFQSHWRGEHAYGDPQRIIGSTGV